MSENIEEIKKTFAAKMAHRTALLALAGGNEQNMGALAEALAEANEGAWEAAHQLNAAAKKLGYPTVIEKPDEGIAHMPQHEIDKIYQSEAKKRRRRIRVKWKDGDETTYEP